MVKEEMVIEYRQILPIKKKQDSVKKQRINYALNSFRELYKNKNSSTDKDWIAVANLIKSI
jgi:hypothetical protein